MQALGSSISKRESDVGDQGRRQLAGNLLTTPLA